ncbi:TolC family protein [Dyadobacter sp.]|uniref:TolC family protein n=1 Tax=Dyadobacter sp. TaxID=1914288 RepID=UPI003F721B48
MNFNFKVPLRRLLHYAFACFLTISAHAQEVTLQEYVDYALKNNQGVKQQGFLLERNLYALKEAKALFLPEVNLNASYLDSRGGRKISIPIGDLLNPVYNSLNQLTNTSAFPEVENVSQTFNPNNYYDARFRTSLPIYNAEIIYNSRIKKEQINFQQAELDVYKRELVKEVKLAYYACLQANESVSIMQNAVSLARDNLRFNQVLVKNDKAIRTVVSRSENELIGLEARLEDARNQAVNAIAYFNFLLNKPLDSPVSLPRQETQSLLPDQAAEGKREELTRLETLSRINALSVQLARSAALPKLSTFIDLGSQGDFLRFNNDTRYYLFGVTLDWRVFAANRVQHRTKQAEMEVKAAGAQLDQVEQQLLLQTQTATNRLGSAMQIYQASKSQTGLSQQYYHDQQKLYREGQLLYIELLDAQNRLISDQLQQSISYLNVQTRAAELERAKASYVLPN